MNVPKLLIACVVLLVAFAGQVRGDVITIDFTDASIWGGANGRSSFTQNIGGVNVSITAEQFGPLTISSIGVGILDDQITYNFQPSASSSLNYGVQSLQFLTGVINLELPIDAALFRGGLF